MSVAAQPRATRAAFLMHIPLSSKAAKTFSSAVFPSAHDGEGKCRRMRHTNRSEYRSAVHAVLPPKCSGTPAQRFKPGFSEQGKENGDVTTQARWGRAYLERGEGGKNASGVDGLEIHSSHSTTGTSVEKDRERSNFDQGRAWAGSKHVVQFESL
ncbi:hypothetical protein B0H19DRAFT_1074118 [Mycena capillaripes]|nr:hypothetical protein B0H19DRAFT_1074118 [Mycena capillaripes]